MSSIAQLKKKLKSIRTTGKMSKAMKAVSAAKFARLSAMRRTYSQYAAEFRAFCGDTPANAGTADALKTDTVLVLGSNLGFCGGFNTDACDYLDEYISKNGHPAHLIACGGKMISTLTDRGLNPEHSFVFNDIPTFKECETLFTLLEKIAGKRHDYPVRIIRPIYRNTMVQTPGTEILTVEPDMSCINAEDMLFFPDKATVLSDLPSKAFHALLFSAVLDTALGAQAATLMTMRTAYDNAAEYIDALEKQIHRQRQNEVTSDVLETSSDRSGKGDAANA